jgi:hypothetical protein
MSKLRIEELSVAVQRVVARSGKEGQQHVLAGEEVLK